MPPRFQTSLFVWLLLLFPAAAQADSVESVIMPGKLIEGHAKLENDCKNCHVPFNKSAQRGLCLDCHKKVAADVQSHQGYHGRIPEQDCRACHTDHKGRDMNIAAFNHKTFDHRLTDYPLRGAHTDPKVRCEDCHKPGTKFRDAPSDCFACHKKDDKHKGNLGPHCEDCHSETKWKDTRFDHSKTSFPLTGKHADVSCRECHADPRFKDAPTQCVACHRKDDQKNGHHGKFGEKCEACHVTKDWKAIQFDHDRDTQYPLRGKHRFAKCTSCHTGFLYKEKLPTTCIACHRKDDTHKGRFGDRCQTCHTERDWKLPTFDHNRDTKYPLLGKHADVKCTSCHTGNLYRDKLPTTCVACHRKDDKHRGQEGSQCESCHNERSWKKVLFDHGLTRFPLLGAHAKVACSKCHTSAEFKDAKTECVSCHQKDDKHKLRLGPRCEQCHDARTWKAWSFDHDRRTRFPLDGGHKGLQCEACHTRAMPSKVSTDSSCVSCHDGDDVHDGSFGEHCDRCHVTSSFKNIRPGLGITPR